MQTRTRSGWQWEDLSLARQFALAGGTVMLVAVLAVGLWVSRRIEDVVVRNTANATAPYMESFVSPLLQELSDRDDLSPETRLEVAKLLDETALGQRVVSFPALAAALSLLALPVAQASTPSAAALQALGVPALVGKHGADDPAGDDRGGKGGGKEDPAGHTWMATPGLILAKHGADDPAGNDRGGRGWGDDDGANHT